MLKTESLNLLALDVGDVRVGVALATYPVYLPQALITIKNDSKFFENLSSLVKQHNISRLVIGLPRNMDSKDTAQTLKVKDFANQIKSRLQLEVDYEDEFLTSQKAEEILREQSKNYLKEDVDKLAAAIILEDYLKGNLIV